ncbi:MAG: hypothetical protein JRH14_17890 [Deltaproteobacteria bacterium]|nr:hypothetical protein [Deltaproteobacteria bacterium]
MRPMLCLLIFAVACSSSEGAPQCGEGGGSPPKNPFLADSIYAIPHGNSAQQDSTLLAGPMGPTKTLGDEERNYQQIGPGHFGIYISSRYADGSRVVWTNGADRIAKLSHDTFEVLAEYPLDPDNFPAATDEQIDAAIDALDSNNCNEGIESQSCMDLIAQASALASRYLTGLSGVYAQLDSDHTLYVGGSDRVTAYGEVDPADPTSAIEVKRVWPAGDTNLSDIVPGGLVGFNMTFDGWIVIVTDLGWMVALSRDFQHVHTVQLNFAERDAQAHNDRVASQVPPLRGFNWVRNPMAIDQEGGIFVASNDHMHRVMWMGDAFSLREEDGAWTEPYSNSRGLGTGATPSLVGFGDEDQFVVITDGDEVMNMTYFWRDAIPEGWEQLAGMPSRRIAGQLPANFGDPNATEAQSEQSVVVAGYGAVVVNNQARNIPENFTGQTVLLFSSFLGNDPLFQPFGMQKFEWDPEAQKLKEVWANTTISSPNSVPYISRDSEMVYTVGARDGLWTLEGVDFCGGRSNFHYVVGGSRYNSLFSGVHLDQGGWIIYGNPFGKLRLDIN